MIIELDQWNWVNWSGINGTVSIRVGSMELGQLKRPKVTKTSIAKATKLRIEKLNECWRPIWDSIIDEHNTKSTTIQKTTKELLIDWFSDELLNKTTKVTYATIAQDLEVSTMTIKRLLTKEMKESIKNFNKSYTYRQCKKSNMPSSKS